VCEPVCWNKEAQLCETCAPDLDEEIASAQAQAAKAQAIEKARDVNYLGERDLTRRAPVTCPQCGARTQGGKFCPECGAGLAQKKQCAQCGATAEGSPKFCPECGQPYGG
jgi:membrane protease subunit (stomatin/prohibitin family)